MSSKFFDNPTGGAYFNTSMVDSFLALTGEVADASSAGMREADLSVLPSLTSMPMVAPDVVPSMNPLSAPDIGGRLSVPLGSDQDEAMVRKRRFNMLCISGSGPCRLPFPHLSFVMASDATLCLSSAPRFSALTPCARKIVTKKRRMASAPSGGSGTLAPLVILHSPALAEDAGVRVAGSLLLLLF